jgi:hypothetical protein
MHRCISNVEQKESRIEDAFVCAVCIQERKCTSGKKFEKVKK